LSALCIPLLRRARRRAVLAGLLRIGPSPFSPAGLVPYDNAFGPMDVRARSAAAPEDKATLTIRATDQHQFDATWLDATRPPRYRGWARRSTRPW